ncbi:MAG: alpha-amylase [Chlorobi bacterium]|nr:alpha-amylase [Chlorobiota bacterium]
MNTPFLLKSKKITIILISFLLLIVSCNQANNKEKTKPNTDGVNWQNKVIYEVNIRQYTPEGTFKAFEKHLPRLKELGVDILWLMPVNPIGEKNRKGSEGSYYSVKDYRAVNPEFGTLDEFKSLVNEIHKMGMFVILDWVANHTAWDNNLITEHPDWYTHDSTGQIVAPVPDWTDVADLNYDNKDLRNYMTQSLEYWINETNIDGYRCDVAGMVPTDFWDSTRIRLEQIKPVFMLAEWESPELVKNAFNMDYGWYLLHVMNGIAKGEKNVSAIDTMLNEQTPKYPASAFRMYFTTNHDENSWNGTVFERYGDGAKTFSILCFTLDGMPLIYSGQEVGSKKALKFFDKDTINWTDNGFTNFYKILIDLKHENKALRTGIDGGSFIKVPVKNNENVYSFIRQNNNDKVWVLLNLSNKEQNVVIDNNENIGGVYNELFTLDKVKINHHFELKMHPWEYRIYVR